MSITIKNISATLLALAVTAVTAQASDPNLSYQITGNELVIIYTGTLLQSADAVSWSEVASATSPYKIVLSDKKLFFCAKGTESKDITIPLSDKVNLDLIWVEPGTFTMGSPPDELGNGGDETLHEVTLTQGYWLGKYEVTQAQYQTIMGTNPSYSKRSDRPVEQVRWDDAKAFCEKLTAQEKAAGRLPEGYEYTLPTEAQWEYACRAGTTTALNNGKNLSKLEESPEMDEVGWYKYNGDNTTHPAGQKQPNAWGLYDMHGNVFEWCLDWFASYPTEVVTNPEGPAIGKSHVIRGGSYGSYAKYCRSAYRSYNTPFYTSSYCGFRVALAKSKDFDVPFAEDVKLELVWIRTGTFIMGSPKDEVGRFPNEVQHEVTLTQGYWLGKYEITQAQYEAVTGENPSGVKGSDLPVEMVSWENAMVFCKMLTKREKAAGRLPVGYEYTLPTEAQWEYACRAETVSALNSGKNLSDLNQCSEMDEVGWYWYNSDKTAHPVGQKQPNAWGLYDMHGNVFEWCLDWFSSYPNEAVTDPDGSSTGSSRIMRGGSYGSSYARYCRSAYRSYSLPTYTSSYCGFRVALAPINLNKTISLSPKVELNMILIEPGTFMMGSSENEPGRNVDETQHQVTLTQGYWLGKYEVTQAQYEAITGKNPSYQKGDNLPVEMVSWSDAMAFCVKLTEIEKSAGRLPEGYEYTLPTEAQWEYACRAGTTVSMRMDEVEWYQYNSDNRTHPVGQKLPNAWGLYDMHGNVWEMCLDWYGDYPTISVTDPKGPDIGSERVLRGGAYDSDGYACRSENRYCYSPSIPNIFLGFRVALAPVK